ncbi:hypothetical protein JOQ06_013605 [Pogonophryne albipinna]|uniref:TIR domain-containing protein n=1 Tax=Pogonophryne albipinna TaxID=1090488 RepID=A0AAD6FR95_9TELE|nr:hypothetical protein JOQ06_013605 [Pogonophryne albipinna]
MNALNCLLPTMIIICCLMPGPHNCVALPRKTSCHVHDSIADCSHLSLSAVPQNLPSNIISLDLSHNRLKSIPPVSLSPYPGLCRLSVSHNSITKLDPGLCQALPLLQTLNMGHNQVHVLKKEDVNHCTNLTWLIMASNKLKLQGEPFSALQRLQVLDVSLNKLQSAKLGTQIQLPNLVSLNLALNDFTTLKKDDFLFLNNSSSLLVLNMSCVPLKMLEPGSFKPISGLHYNFIKQILTGKEFEGLDQVEEIYMSNNQQTVNLKSTSFVNVPNLRVLTLRKSLKAEAVNLDPSPFSPLTNLTFLDLSNNNIANIREDMLKGLANLKVLKLQHNNIARLWKSANLGGPVLFLKHTPRLVTLQMDSNGLDEIPAEALRGLGNLRNLNLSSNLFNRLKDTIFDDLDSLRVLNVQKNLITAVRPEVFKTPLANLSLLVMDKNPFDCTCETMLWFVTWLNETNMTHVPGLRDQYLCNTPLAYFNRSIMEFDPLSCKDMTPFQTLYILSSTAVVMLIVTAFVVRYQGWRILFYWNILINRTLGFSDAHVAEGREFKYDAYIIHAEQDSSWVERRLSPLENDKCKFCLEDRDSLPGMSQPASILDNMKKSRKILFVVTETLLRDPWCTRFIAQHAIHRDIEANRDSVILVFLQDVHDYKLSRSLYLRRGMLRPCCILDWPVHKERVPAFHQKLLMALGMTNRLMD